MALEGIMLREKGQPQKVTCCMIPLIKHSPNDNVIEMENRTGVGYLRVRNGGGEKEVWLQKDSPREISVMMD